MCFSRHKTHTASNYFPTFKFLSFVFLRFARKMEKNERKNSESREKEYPTCHYWISCYIFQILNYLACCKILNRIVEAFVFVNQVSCVIFESVICDYFLRYICRSICLRYNRNIFQLKEDCERI